MESSGYEIQKYHKRVLKIIAIILVLNVYSLLFMYLLHSLKIISFFSNIPQINDLFALVYYHLQGSIVPFSIVLLCYVFSFKKIVTILEEKDVNICDVQSWKHLNEAFIELFFGIGVIWTAIGMESALTGALGGFNEQMAKSLGAWAILKKLLDGGIITALSTTIVGGSGGYLMRITNKYFLNPKIAKVRDNKNNEYAKKFIGNLEDINENLIDLKRCILLDGKEKTNS